MCLYDDNLFGVLQKATYLYTQREQNILIIVVPEKIFGDLTVKSREDVIKFHQI